MVTSSIRAGGLKCNCSELTGPGTVEPAAGSEAVRMDIAGRVEGGRVGSCSLHAVRSVKAMRARLRIAGRGIVEGNYLIFAKLPAEFRRLI